MSTKRATHASVLNQQQQHQPSPNISVDDDGDVNPRAFHKLSKNFHDLKTQIDAMQVNYISYLSNLRHPKIINMLLLDLLVLP